MHSGYDIPGGIQQPAEPPENSPSYDAPPGALLPMSTQAHILDQRQLFLDHQPNNHFLPTNQYAAGAGASYFPAVNFKLGLNNNINNINYGSSTNNKNDVSIIDQGGDANVRHGSERFQVPEARQPPLGMLHCWQNQQDSSIKQPPPFWEHLTISEVSNENSDDDKRSQQHFGELEAIYKPLVTTANRQQQTDPSEVNVHEEKEEEEEEEASNGKNKKRKKRRSIRHMMAEFFGSLVKQVVDHQETMHKRFAEVMERLEEERKARDEDWRKREVERHEQESEEREREKASAKGREAMIVSYLERITGERIVGSFSEFDPMEINNNVIPTKGRDNTGDEVMKDSRD